MNISIIIPTLNSEKYLSQCLSSIKKQNYKYKIEILIVDGGSKDKTIKIAKKFKTKIYKNILKTGEAGKMIGLKKSKYEYVLFLDSDNEIPNTNWIKKLSLPLQDKDIVSAEPIKFCYFKNLGHIDRYCSLIGMNDPLNFFIGNYDKYSLLSNKWTNLDVKQIKTKNFTKVSIDKISSNLTYGANGTLYKKEILKNLTKKNYFFDVDILNHLINKKRNYFAKTNQCIIHYYCKNNYFKFYKKQSRRINDFLKYNKLRKKNNNLKGYVFFIISCVLIFPIIFQTLKLFIKSRDISSINHIILVYITLFTYSYHLTKKLFF